MPCFGGLLGAALECIGVARRIAKVSKRKKLFVLPPMLAVVVLSMAMASAGRVTASRFRLTLEQVQDEERRAGPFVSLFEFLRLRTLGVVSPRPGTRFRVTAVAYSSTVSQTDLTPCITAAGTRVRPGIVATNFLPLGTQIRIGDETYVVEDRMNERYDGVHIIDVWHPTTKQARDFGVRPLEIEVLGKPEKAKAPTAQRPSEEDGGAVPPASEVVPKEAPAGGTLGSLRERMLELGRLLKRFLSVRVSVPEEAACLEEQ